MLRGTGPMGESASVAARRLLIGALLMGMLSACGFHLRGTASLPHESLYISSSPYSPFANDLKRSIRAGTNTRIAEDAASADATLFILGEARAKSILTLTSQGTVREFQLRYAVSYRLANKEGQEIVPQSEIALVRSYVYNDQQALAAESEEALLYRDMQQDAVQQLLRRMGSPANRPPVPAPPT